MTRMPIWSTVVLVVVLGAGLAVMGEELEPPPPPDGPPPVVYGERVGIGTPVHVPAGQVRRGDVVAIMAPATIEGDVDGDVVNVMGDLQLTGRVDGDVVAVLSNVELGQGAQIEGEFVQVLGSLDDRGASIRGQHVSVPNVLLAPGINGGFGGLVAVWLWFRAALLVAAFFGIFALAALLPRWTLDGSAEISRRPLIALLVGAGLQVAALPLLILLLVLSILGILLVPFVLIVYITILAAGFAVVMHWVGERIARAAGREISVLGAVALGFVVLAVLFFVPVLGTLIWILAAWLGVGALALARFPGDRRARPAASTRESSAPAEPLPQGDGI